MERFVYYYEIIVIRLNIAMIFIYLSQTYLVFVCVYGCFLVTALVVRGSASAQHMALSGSGGGGMEEQI